MEQFEIRQACERLLHDYAWTQDNADVDGFAALFAPDAVWVRPPGRGTLQGRDAILESARATFKKTPQEQGLHCISNFRLDINDDEVSSTCYSIGFSGSDSGTVSSLENQPAAVLVYRNRFRLVDGVWRISRHESEFRFRR